MAQTKKADFQFAKNLEQLEKLVDEMEQGDLSLENALTKFEQGIALTRQCQKALEQAEQKVQIILADSDGGEKVVPYDAENS